MTGLGLAPIEPLRQAEPGCYDDELVSVRFAHGPDRLVATHLRDGRIGVRHSLTSGGLDDGLAERLDTALAPLTGDHAAFARAFTGVVVTSATDPLSAWTAFYRNSLATLIDRRSLGYPEVYRYALRLLPTTSVLDLGCGFGFLSLHLAALGAEVFAADVEPGTLDLLRLMSDHLQRRVSVLDTDGQCVPLLAQSIDAVVMLHVLEHVTAAEGAAAVAEAMRVARNRVVIAVPFEDHPTTLYGHVRRFGPGDLHELGTHSGWDYDVHEHHGGWLVLDRPSASCTDHPTG
jgi:SAM-dependent methyltransferase